MLLHNDRKKTMGASMEKNSANPFTPAVGKAPRI